MSYGVLYVVSTPIGNLEDFTLRAISTLNKSKVIAAEDTRQSKKLLNKYNISTPLLSYFDHNKSYKIPIIIEYLKNKEEKLYLRALQLVNLLINFQIQITFPLKSKEPITRKMN